MDENVYNKRVKAIINWEGFRKQRPVPAGTRYGPQIQFDGEDVFKDKEIWSSDIIVGKTDKKNQCEVLIKYLEDSAPICNIRSGNSFKLFEGPTYVAKGVIL